MIESFHSNRTGSTGSTAGAPRAATRPEDARTEGPGNGDDPRPEASGDRATLTPEGLLALAQEEAEGGAPGELTEEERRRVEELRLRDREVRAHEEAHKAAAGDLATSGPTYETETGPDGREYAVGGEVGIALREGDTPEESLALAQRARRAALAPAEPSAQDRAVAAEASRMAAAAQAELAAEKARDPELERRTAAYGASTPPPEEPPGLLPDLFA